MECKYPSDIELSKFETIECLLVTCRKKTKTRTVDLHAVFCGVLYILKSGCQWRMLPKDYPKWQTCYKYFTQWSEYRKDIGMSTLELVLKKISWRGPYKPWSQCNP